MLWAMSWKGSKLNSNCDLWLLKLYHGFVKLLIFGWWSKIKSVAKANKLLCGCWRTYKWFNVMIDVEKEFGVGVGVGTQLIGVYFGSKWMMVDSIFISCFKYCLYSSTFPQTYGTQMLNQSYFVVYGFMDLRNTRFRWRKNKFVDNVKERVWIIVKKIGEKMYVWLSKLDVIIIIFIVSPIERWQPILIRKIRSKSPLTLERSLEKLFFTITRKFAWLHLTS